MDRQPKDKGTNEVSSSAIDPRYAASVALRTMGRVKVGARRKSRKDTVNDNHKPGAMAVPGHWRPAGH